MKFSVLALDYDGTIAGDAGVDPGVRAAIANIRSRGIVVILVTGRILEDLRRVAGDLHFVDAVVAENGAVMAFPSSGYTERLAAAPAPVLLEALTRAGVTFAAGQSVVEADAREGGRILAVIRQLELPLVIVFNRGRLMVLPQAVSKATGLRQALMVLRLSPHNAVGIGDAENDHELLQACEVGVAVGWGSQALQAAADYVVPGAGPRALGPYLDALANRARVPAPVKTRRRLRLGHSADGRPFELAVRGRNLLIAGDPRSGKSWVAGLLCEQLILQGYCLCVIDPEGDYTSLEVLPGVSVFGGVDPLPRPRDLLRALRHPDGSVVVDLSHTPQEAKLEYVRTLLPSLAKLRRRTGLPHRVVLDEAHYVLHDPDVRGLIDLELNGYTFVTYRASQLQPEVLAATQAIVVTCESDPKEVEALAALCRSCPAGLKADWAGMVGSLVIGEAVVLPVTDEAEGLPRRIQLSPRITPHDRHVAKYVDIPVTPGRAFVFTADGGRSGPVARTLRELVGGIEHLPVRQLDAHLKRGDISRWIAEVFGDYPLASAVRQVEGDYRAGQSAEVADRLSQAVRARYEFLGVD